MHYDMQYSTLGRTGLKVSRIGYGASALGDMYTPTDIGDGERCLFKAVEEYGINYIDTSPSYGYGSLSEQRLGVILEKGLRNQVILASKCGDYFHGSTWDTYYRDYSPKTLREQLESQLKRLKTDHLDVLQIHDVTNMPLDYLLEETIPELQKVKQEGKTRFIGITGANIHALRYILTRTDCMDVVLTFGRYNLMDTSVVGFFDDLREKQNFGLLNCSVLFMGFLTRRMLTDSYKMVSFLSKHAGFEEAMEGLREASALCDAAGVDIGSLAVQFGCDCPACDSTMLAMSREQRLIQNMALLAKPYDKELAKRVYDILSKCNVVSMLFNHVGRLK